MAAEPETLPPPPEPPIATAPETAPATTTAELTAAQHQPSAEIAGPPPKRHRRPSVRLGEIGDQRAATVGHDSHTRRPNVPPWSWRIPKESSRTSKARSLTNLANGGEEFGERNDVVFGNRRGKTAKRGSSTTKRLRSNYAPRTTDDDDGEEEVFRDFDHSPVNSNQENELNYWHIGRHRDHVRVSENDGVGGGGVESELRERRMRSEGVRSWLVELGLSRYAPMFEIHEVDDELLPMLTLEDLKDMGINAVGSRRKMYTAIQKLRKGFP